jgi:hypothetical protein
MTLKASLNEYRTRSNAAGSGNCGGSATRVLEASEIEAQMAQ